MHREINRKTLRGVLNQAGVSLEEFFNHWWLRVTDSTPRTSIESWRINYRRKFRLEKNGEGLAP